MPGGLEIVWGPAEEGSPTYFVPTPQTAILAAPVVRGGGDVDGDGLWDLAAVVAGSGFGPSGHLLGFYGPAGEGEWLVADWHLTGESLGARISALADSADYNGDGRTDRIAMDRPAGRWFMFLGSEFGSSGPQLIQAEFPAGVPVGSGDFDGDGRADLALIRDPVGVSVAFGADPLPLLTGLWINTDAFMGADAVYPAGVGDLDGDGFEDLVAAAANYGGGVFAAGELLGFFGGPGGPAEVATSLYVHNEGYVSGHHGSLAGVGDLNGDGYADFVASAENDSSSGPDVRLLVFFGQGSGLPVLAATVSGETTEDRIGVALAPGGDPDGDGFAEFVTDRRSPSAGLSAGLLYGGSPGYPAAGPAQEASLIPAGDLDGDGFDEVVVITQSQSLQLIGGGREPLEDPTPFGPGVTILGGVDVDGDGYPDLVVADPDEGLGGIVRVHRGSPDGPSTAPDWVIEGATSDELGLALVSAGDPNRDGYGDFWVQADGFLRLYLGSWAGPLESLLVVVEHDDAVVSAGEDLDGDDFADLVIGMPSSGPGGEVHVHLGRPGDLFNQTPDVVLSGAPGSGLGAAVLLSGDLTGDGLPEVVASAAIGEVLVFPGSPTGPAAPAAWTLTAPSEEVDFGSHLASVETRTLGASDLAVGAVGHVFLWEGASSGLAAEPSWSTETSGGVVRPGGDIDGDGYGDLLIDGAVFFGNRSDGTGSAFSLRPRQLRPETGLPIPPGGRSDSATSFQLAVDARTYRGRARVKLWIEVQPVGTPFDGTASHVGDEWIDIGIDGIEVAARVDGLEPDTAYHWRARLLFDPSQNPAQPWSRWLFGGANERKDGVHFRTPTPDADGDLEPDRTDCGPDEASVHPGAEEVADDGVDQDCDGLDTVACTPDQDADGYRASGPRALHVDRCPEGLLGVEIDLDCDDADAAVHPGGDELCDMVDSDCDGDLVDEFADEDGDGLPDCDSGDDDDSGPEDCPDGCDCSHAASGGSAAFLVVIALAAPRRRRTAALSRR